MKSEEIELENEFNSFNDKVDLNKFACHIKEKSGLGLSGLIFQAQVEEGQ